MWTLRWNIATDPHYAIATSLGLCNRKFPLCNRKAYSCGGCSTITFRFQTSSHWFQGWTISPCHIAGPWETPREPRHVHECVWKERIKDLLSTTWCLWCSIRDRVRFKAVWKTSEWVVFQRQAMIAECEGFTTVHCLSLIFFLIEARRKGRLYACLRKQTGSLICCHATGKNAGCPTGYEPSLSLSGSLFHHLADVSTGE